MAKPDSLGQFEQLVLTAVLTLRDDTYGDPNAAAVPSAAIGWKPSERALQESAVAAKRIWDVIAEVLGKEWAKE